MRRNIISGWHDHAGAIPAVLGARSSGGSATSWFSSRLGIAAQPRTWESGEYLSGRSAPTVDPPTHIFVLLGQGRVELVPRSTLLAACRNTSITSLIDPMASRWGLTAVSWSLKDSVRWASTPLPRRACRRASSWLFGWPPALNRILRSQPAPVLEP